MAVIGTSVLGKLGSVMREGLLRHARVWENSFLQMTATLAPIPHSCTSLLISNSASRHSVHGEKSG